MNDYRRQLAEALAFLADRGAAWRASQAEQMRQASRRFDFEHAQRLKNRIHRAGELDHDRYRWLADIEEMNFLIVQPGARKAELRTFRSFSGRLVVGPALTRKALVEGLALWMDLSPPPEDRPAQAEEAGLLASYLFRGQRDRGAFIRVAGQTAGQLAEEVAAALAPAQPATGVDSDRGSDTIR